jgi:hypothetical protein
MSMPLIAVFAIAATGIVATASFVGDTTVSPGASSAWVASTTSTEEWTRRGTRSLGHLATGENVRASSDAPRRGMRTSPEILQRAPIAGSGDWTRRGTRNT